MWEEGVSGDGGRWVLVFIFTLSMAVECVDTGVVHGVHPQHKQ